MRMAPAIERLLPKYQSAYRPGRSTADAVWAKRWIISAVEHCRLKLFMLGIDLSRAFDTILRGKLMLTLRDDGWANEDELRMIQYLLSNTKLCVRIGQFFSDPFLSNLGSPQGDGLSATLFIIYLASALKDVDAHSPPRPQLDITLCIPPKLAYADDVDFISSSATTLDGVFEVADRVLPLWGLVVNKSKTERTELLLHPAAGDCVICERVCRSNAVQCDRCKGWAHYKCTGATQEQIHSFETDSSAEWLCRECVTTPSAVPPRERGKEPWRHSRYLGTLLGVSEDIAKRTQLASAAFGKLYKLWIRRTHVSLARRMRLYNAFVLPHLVYNAGTQGLSHDDENKLDCFHRRQLRRVLGVFFPDVITNVQLYTQTKSVPLSSLFRNARWRLFGHILRLPSSVPAVQAMHTYFIARSMFPRRGGTPRSCLVSTLQRDLKNVENVRGLTLESLEDLDVMKSLASDRSQWVGLCEDVCKF